MITQPAPDIAEPVILVVDDDEAVRDSVRNMMESEGFEVRAFSNGHDLLNEASLPAVGCMVVDCPHWMDWNWSVRCAVEECRCRLF